jgi:photoactive yellow protein
MQPDDFMPIESLDRHGFASITLDHLDSLTQAQFDALAFGVIGFPADCLVEIYSAYESKAAGIPAAKVIGSHFFLSTAQCMNNFMVAQRFLDEPALDVIIDFVLTLRMRPTPVRLRLLKRENTARRYILVQR